MRFYGGGGGRGGGGGGGGREGGGEGEKSGKNTPEATLVSLFLPPGSLRNPTVLGVYRQGTKKLLFISQPKPKQ